MKFLNFFKKKNNNQELQITTRYTSGVALMENNRLEEAIAQFQKVLSLKPDHTLAHYHLGEIFYQKDEFEKALTYFEKSLKLNQDEIEPANIHMALATTFFSLDQLEQAVKEFEKAIEFDPGKSAPHLNAGETYYQLGKIDEAIAHFEKASPDDPYTLIYLAKAYWAKRDYEKSITIMREAVKNFPLNPEVTAYFGFLLIEMNRYEEAIEPLLTALENSEEMDEDILGDLGDAYYQTGNLEKSLEIYTQAVELFPDNTFFYRRIGFIYKDQGDLKAALKIWRRMVEVDPSDLDSRGTLALGLRLNGELEAALREMQQIISLDAKTALNYISLGNTFFDLEKYEDARNAFERAVELGDNFALFNLAELYCEWDNAAKAAHYAQAFIKAAQNDPDLEGYIEDAVKILDEVQD